MHFNTEVVSPFIILLITLEFISTASVGDDCYLSNGQTGICQHISSCDSALMELKKRQKPVICGFEQADLFPIVCCQQKDNNPGLTNTRSTNIVDQKCVEFLRPKQLKPGEFGIAAVGGLDAAPMEYRHMAILGYGNGDNIEWACGGSLISEEYVLTAAHCLFSRQYGDVTDVRLGDLDIGSTTDDASPQDFKVVQIIAHPEYSPDSAYHDIGLLKLDRPANFTDYVRPACLQTSHELDTNGLTATGWGATYYGEGTHSALQVVELNQLPVKNCQATYKADRRLLRGVDDALQLCAGNLEKVMDTCTGDSGGPLQRQNDWPAGYRIVGITSFGKQCGLVPAVYTRVSAYIEWIATVVWP